MKNELFNKKALLVSFFLIALIGILSSYYVPKQQNCVVISTWKDCHELCTNAKCIQFTNNCAYTAKITYNCKNSDGTWTKYQLYLKKSETSQESMICPYIDMTWSYGKAN